MPIPAGPLSMARGKQLNCQLLSLLNTYDLSDKNTMFLLSLYLLVLRNKEMGEWKREAQVDDHGYKGQKDKRK